MSEQIVREATAWQGTIEDDYRESAQNFAQGAIEVFICRRLNLHPSSFWQGCPKPDQYLTKHLPNHLTNDASENALRLLGRFFEHYFFAVGQRFNQVLAGKQFICCQIKPNKIKKQFTHSSHLRASPMATQEVSQTAGRKGASLSANQGNADVLAMPASGPHLRQGDVKRKGADLLVAPLKLNVRLSKCGPRSVGRLRGS